MDRKVKRSGRRPNLVLVVVGMAVTSIGVFEAEFLHTILQQVGAFYGGILACLWIIWLSFARRSMMRVVLSSRPAVALGRVSYSLYLVHPIALQLVWVYILGPESTFSLPTVIVYYLLSVALSLAFAWGFYRLIEAPSIRWMRSVSRARHPSWV